MNFKIKHISFLFEGERKIVKTSVNGRFLVRGKYMGFSNTAGPRSALEFVGMPVIRDSDPVLNLNDGRKIRVYLGGDPSYMVVEAHSLMEIHDNEALEVQERKEKTSREKKDLSSGMQGLYTGADIFEDLEGW